MPIHAVYPGSFDPFTLGHLDVARRALAIFGELTIMVVHNPHKEATFNAQTRIELVRSSLAEAEINQDALHFDVLSEGLLVERCLEIGATAIVKGVRNGADAEYEFAMATINRDLSTVETLLLPAAPELAQISSSLVRQVASLGADVSKYVPKVVAKALNAKFGGVK